MELDEDKLVLEDDNLLIFQDRETKNENGKWNILIVDDEHEIHTSTKQSLNDCEFDNKELNFFSAYSEKEAREILKDKHDIAVILLDVVMEDEDSGLRLVKYIREQLKNDRVRIVLRIDNAEQAPEKKVIMDYDINDYKIKTELTSQKLFTTVVLALRTYKDLCISYYNQIGLKKVAEASSAIFELQSIEIFISKVLKLVQHVMGENYLYNKISGFGATKQEDKFIIIAATDEYEEYIYKNIYDAIKVNITNEVLEQCKEGNILYKEDGFISYFKSEDSFENLIYVKGINEWNEFNKNLIEVFMKNIAVAFNNLHLKQEMENTEKEILFTLGEVAEARSKETNHHVKRVAEYSYLLALKYGLSKEEAELLRKASAMHDIGKLAVPDNILNKPGKLTEDEFEIMKTHSIIGKDILKNSNREIISAGAIIAHQHHEKYNGKGYPLGLKGEEIHIYGRITAIADVFDALGSERVYKKAWKMDKIIELFKEERGKHFDPKLVDIFLENLGDMLNIRDNFRD